MQTASDFGEHSPIPKKRKVLIRIHDTACALCILLAGRFLLMCIFAFHSALDDLRKYEDLGGSRSIFYYLSEEYFWGYLMIFLWVTASLILYIALCRCAELKKGLRYGRVFFSIMPLLHFAMLLHAFHLTNRAYPSFLETIEYYLLFTASTIGPSILYSVLYFTRVWIIRSQKT